VANLLYYSPVTHGGLADYARAQANALAARGMQVDLLTEPSFPSKDEDKFNRLPILESPKPTVGRLHSRFSTVVKILRNQNTLAKTIHSEKYRHVLLGSYTEYLAPLWAGRLKNLVKKGVVFGAIVHDPVRDYVVGPWWWHRHSISLGYSFLREAFVHEPIILDTVRPQARLRTTQIPHGSYAFHPSAKGSHFIRAEWGVPETAKVWLSFGHVRDGKNLDLVIRLLRDFPEAYLIVAGKEQSSGQKPVGFYKKLSEEFGVANRCLWFNRFIEEKEIGDFFVAADLVLLTYSRNFRSASGVLNAAVHFRKPCLASSGQGNLRSVVERYRLGIWVEPDSVEKLIAGYKVFVGTQIVPCWEAYILENSWEKNAEIVSEKMFDSEILFD